MEVEVWANVAAACCLLPPPLVAAACCPAAKPSALSPVRPTHPPTHPPTSAVLPLQAATTEEKYVEKKAAADLADEEGRSAARDPAFEKGQSKRIWGELYKVVDSSDVIIQVCARVEACRRLLETRRHIPAAVALPAAEQRRRRWRFAATRQQAQTGSRGSEPARQCSF